MTHVNRGNSTRNYTVFPWKLPMCCIFELPATAQNCNSFGVTEQLWGNASLGLYLYYTVADLMTVDTICVTMIQTLKFLKAKHLLTLILRCGCITVALVDRDQHELTHEDFRVL